MLKSILLAVSLLFSFNALAIDLPKKPKPEVSVQEDKIVLSWEVPTQRTDLSPLLVEEIGGYEIYYSLNGGDTSTITVPGGGRTTYEFNSPSPGDYEFAIRTYDKKGLFGPASGIFTTTIKPKVELDAPPQAPNNIKLVLDFIVNLFYKIKQFFV